MFTIAGFEESQDTATLAAFAAIADPHIRVTGDDLFVPEFAPILFGVYAGGANLTRAQLRSPSILSRYPFEIEPYDVAAEPASPAAFTDLRRNPLALVPAEPLNLFASEDAAGASIVRAFVFLTDGAFREVSGEIYTIQATNTTTLVAEAWTNGALTFASSLPAGEYAIVGMRARSAGLIAARLVLPGFAHRPGCVGHDAVGDLDVPMFRGGQLGEWGRFTNLTPPTVDFYSLSADTSQTVDLDLIKVG